MTPADIRTWREEIGLTQKEAAEKLGVSLSVYQKYERDVNHLTGGPNIISETVALACAAVKAGLLPYRPKRGVAPVAPRGPGRPAQ